MNRDYLAIHLFSEVLFSFFWFGLWGLVFFFHFYSLLWEYPPPRNFSTKLTEQFCVVIQQNHY